MCSAAKAAATSLMHWPSLSTIRSGGRLGATLTSMWRIGGGKCSSSPPPLPPHPPQEPRLSERRGAEAALSPSAGTAWAAPVPARASGGGTLPPLVARAPRLPAKPCERERVPAMAAAAVRRGDCEAVRLPARWWPEGRLGLTLLAMRSGCAPRVGRRPERGPSSRTVGSSEAPSASWDWDWVLLLPVPPCCPLALKGARDGVPRDALPIDSLPTELLEVDPEAFRRPRRSSNWRRCSRCVSPADRSLCLVS
mmetsp:Transcript_55555/g.140579  ORF Transcript_55555/g.140579 Transcript_55555/m.140579 type:complete len:252 (+) Transcript_55555:391-1146(+)